MANREKGTFPSQYETNPKGWTSSDFAPDTFRKVNAIITLRSGKEIDNHVGDNLNEKSDIPPTITTDDFGESKKDQAHIDKIRETFSQVKINIPFLDALQQMPRMLDFWRSFTLLRWQLLCPRELS